ncbi:SURF1 family protein [Inhella inkyongensis]|nr:SURF1 family protein [Inhella inkyongensis]
MLGLTLLGVAATAALGMWQLGRAQDKLQRQAQLQAAQQASALTATELLAEPRGPWLQREAVLHGRWMPEQQIWLDNRPHDRRVGTLLLTPLRLQGGAVIWVQRGWQARAPGQHAVPPWPPTPDTDVQVRGRLALHASQAYAMGPEGSGALRQNLDLAASRSALGVTPLPWVLWQIGPDCAPLRCDWPEPDSGVHKHWGYAAQWFALAALILGLYVWYQHLRPARAKR